MAQRIEPPAQPQRTQSAEEFLNTWMDDQIANSSGWDDKKPWYNSDLVNFAEAYAQSLKQAAAPQVNATDLARRFHTLYEALAPKFGYETREESAKPWSQVPENNKRLMEAVCEEIIAEYVLVAEYRTSSRVTTAPTEPFADPSKEELKAAPIEIGWLIEKIVDDRPQWLTCAWTFGWTDDAGNAIRFCCRDDAEQIATMITFGAEIVEVVSAKSTAQISLSESEERGAPPEKPVCLICGLPPDHEWHGVSNHVYVPKLAGHDSAGAAQPKMKDDPVYGAIRVAICDEYIAAGSPTPKENWLYSRLVEARTQFAYEAGAANSPSPEVRQAWVSVTEKFPPDNQPVLVLRSNDWHRMQIEYYCKNGPYDSGFFLDGEMDTNVTHWMPLPPGPAAPPATKEGK